MTVYQWSYEILYPVASVPQCSGQSGYSQHTGCLRHELVRTGAVVTSKPSRDTARRVIHREIHVREFFELRINQKPREIRI